MSNRFRFLVVLLVATAAFAGKPASDVPVTTYLADYDAGNAPYYLQSDGGGAYNNGVAGSVSILVANGYNGIVWGDWRLDLLSSTSRTVAITFASSNAVQPGDPGYQAPAAPPYWGTQFLAARMEDKCTQDNHNMLTMRVGDSFHCSMVIRLPNDSSGGHYGLNMWPSVAAESSQVQVSCNSADSGGCKDWFIDPIPVVNADGTTSPGRARARLGYLSRTGKSTNSGDFYLTFHIHVTRP
ncbi:MAG: hypothetical protein M3P27_09255 [Acidobacteriota bacterium]|nr:hypothetical protein [Acidobacteriota bacterium]